MTNFIGNWVPSGWRRLLFGWAATAVVTVACRAGGPPPSQPRHWVGTWAAAPLAVKNESGTFGPEAGSTLREIVHISIGGASVRAVLSNEFGVDPLTIAAAQVGVSAGGGSVVATKTAALTFGGKMSVTIPPGAMVVSDAAALSVAPLSDVAVSLFIPSQPLRQLSLHPFADQTNYLVPGNAVAATTLEAPAKTYRWEFLKGLEVEAEPSAAAIVTLGDSITDGAYGTRDTNPRWPDVLARRLQANKATAKLGILNEGIGGNRILNEGTGPAALARLDRDVLAQPGVKYLVVLEGINDIGRTAKPREPEDTVTAEQLIFALDQMITRAHAHGIKVIGATLTPYVGADYASPEGEKMRQAENKFIRHSGKFDAVIDFDRATADPAHPDMFLPAYDCGDHLHPNDAGYKAMGDAIDLKIFGR